MKYSIRTITGPASEPVSLAEARLQCRVDSVEDDAGIARRILAARTYLEQITGRAFITQTLELALDDFPCDVIELPRTPVASIVSITYLDSAGAAQTMPSSDYVLDGYSLPPRITPAYGKTWPATRGTAANVKVQFMAGEASAPDPIVQAILVLVANWNESRETPGENPAVTALIAPYRTHWL